MAQKAEDLKNMYDSENEVEEDEVFAECTVCNKEYKECIKLLSGHYICSRDCLNRVISCGICASRIGSDLYSPPQISYDEWMAKNC